jgi:hypothetical protein
MRRDREQQVNVVSRNVSFFDIHIQRGTGLADQFPQAGRNFATQDGLAILGDPDNVILEIVDRVRSFSIVHAPILLRSVHSFNFFTWKTIVLLKTACLKGRGFYPIYGQ